MSADFARAVFAFLALPGVVAFVAPLWIVRGDPGAHAFAWPGLPVLALGVFALLWCVRDFYVSGKGTLAPWAPPRHLVVVGLYRWSRNPMYLAVLTILVGWAIGFGSPRLALYAAAVAVAFHLRVLLNEEPFLARTHGDAWQQYRARVRRWL
jgi:protein-S-isoprenylcysteine O-methyltransferase Ste14